jgi:hypothetical protein
MASKDTARLMASGMLAVCIRIRWCFSPAASVTSSELGLCIQSTSPTCRPPLVPAMLLSRRHRLMPVCVAAWFSALPGLKSFSFSRGSTAEQYTASPGIFVTTISPTGDLSWI